VVSARSAVKICSGSPIPRGADAVVSDEFCEEVSSEVNVRATAEYGRNVLRAGEDIKAGTIIAEKGKVILPGCLGLIAAAGVQYVKVYRRPKAAVVAVGDEVVAPGGHLHPGQLYASNLVTIAAWLASFGIPYDTAVVGDNEDAIRQELLNRLPNADVILTSGGAWGSERDLVVGTLDELGWHKVFHHVRMGPGKGIAFGLWESKPVFCLPGGPASNEMAFLQLALPGIMRMGGQSGHPLQTVSARLTQNLEGRHRAWTEFKDATLSCDLEGNYIVTPYRNRSRLQAIANANCLVRIPEGVESLHLGEVVPVQILVPTFGGLSIDCQGNK
jgi:molybdopterin molybdotransferase